MHLQAERGEMEIFPQAKEEVDVSGFHRQQDNMVSSSVLHSSVTRKHLEGRLAN